jgi:hypothetical protein
VLVWIDLVQPFPWLMMCLFFLFLPLIRWVFPVDLVAINDEKIPAWLASYLYWLPSASALIWLAVAVALPFTFKLSDRSVFGMVSMWVSVWIAASLTLPACHELIHRMGSPLERFLGRVASASNGLVALSEEHLIHHAKSGKGKDPDCPDQSESVYAYSLRTVLSSLTSAWDYEMVQQIRKARAAWTNRIFWTSAVTICFAAIWTWQQGLAGLVFFTALAVGTNFTMRVMTFVQHWGLQDVPTQVGGNGVSWVSSCAFQSWITYNLAFHEHHHRHPSHVYWRLQCSSTELKLPVTYPLAFLASLVPPLYRRLMAPRLSVWVENARRGQQTHQTESCFIPRSRAL